MGLLDCYISLVDRMLLCVVWSEGAKVPKNMTHQLANPGMGMYPRRNELGPPLVNPFLSLALLL